MDETDRLLAFLLETARAPDRLRAVEADPEGALAGTGLSGETASAILSKDPRRISARFSTTEI